MGAGGDGVCASVAASAVRRRRRIASFMLSLPHASAQCNDKNGAPTTRPLLGVLVIAQRQEARIAAGGGRVDREGALGGEAVEMMGPPVLGPPNGTVLKAGPKRQVLDVTE